MSGKVKTISLEEFSSNPKAFFDRVIHRHESLTIQNGAGALAVLMPASMNKRPRQGKWEKTEADYEAFLSSFGGWSDMDIDAIIKNIYESRKLSRPPVEL